MCSLRFLFFSPMNHIQITIRVQNPEQAEMLIALLSELDFEGFEERENLLLAFIAEDQFNRESLEALLLPMALRFDATTIEKTNWNRQWEENFSPVVVDGFCTVRADFHEMMVSTPHEIVITPKMSFGTGHHATTQLMIRLMQQVDFRNKVVFDFGTGTGILAILAEKLGAADVCAIDNDEWSHENAVENAERNQSLNTRFFRCSIEDVPEEQFDVILANINRHILLQYMGDLYQKTAPGGFTLMSGLLIEDKSVIEAAAVQIGFIMEQHLVQDNWLALHFRK